MITLDYPQGTDEWFAARLGIPTASCFDKIMSPTTLKKLSGTDYFATLLAETIAGKADIVASYDMERGTLLEPQARLEYFKHTGHRVTQVGGVFYDNTKTIMGSPDGIIVNMRKGIEIKCLKLKNHIKIMYEGILPTEHSLQCHGNMWLCNYDSWDFVSYCPEHPKKPLWIFPVKRDEKVIKALATHIVEFSERLEVAKKDLLI